MSFTASGIQNTLAYFQALESAVVQAGVHAIQVIEDDARSHAVANAPIRTELLRKSIAGGKISVSASTIRGSIGVFSKARYPKKYNGGKSVQDVAILMLRHLYPYNSGKHLFNLGPRSRSQPGTPEGGVGGTFIERAVMGNANRYALMVQKIMSAALSGTPPGVKP